MGRKHLTLKQHCRGSHFTWAERLKLQYYWTGSNGYRKIRSHTLLEKIFQKSPKTIKRELQRGMVEHVLSDIPFTRIEYNADHAQLDAENRMGGQGATTEIRPAPCPGSPNLRAHACKPLQSICSAEKT